jgi:hypothetical protein
LVRRNGITKSFHACASSRYLATTLTNGNLFVSVMSARESACSKRELSRVGHRRGGLVP